VNMMIFVRWSGGWT